MAAVDPGGRGREQRLRTAQEEARALPREPVSPWVWAVVAVATCGWVGVLAWQAATLPDRVPQHWSGPLPDTWADRPQALAFTALMPLLGLALPLLSRLAIAWPDGVNVPNKQEWTATGPRLRRFERLLREDLWLVGAWTIVLLDVVGLGIGVAAHTPGGRLPGWVDATCIALVVALLGYAVGWMTLGPRYRRVPADL